MKWIFIFVVVVLFGCKKSNTNFTYNQAMDSMQIPFNTPCVCGVGDTVVFYPNQWINERTYKHSISYQVTAQPQIINNVFSITLRLISDTITANTRPLYNDCRFYRLLNYNPFYSTFSRPTAAGTYIHCSNGDNANIKPLL